MDKDLMETPAEVRQSHNMELMKMAVQSEGGVDKLEKIMDLQERWEKNESRKMFFSAITAFQKSLPVIEKKGKAKFQHKEGGGETSYSYAKLEDIAQTIKAPLAKNKLSYRFEQSAEQTNSGPYITVTCIVTHESGHSERSEMGGYPDQSGKKNPIQQLASTVSYLRRYTLTGGLGLTVSDEDDDAASSSSAGGESEFYPKDKFDSNFINWKTQIESGNKNAAQIIGFLNSKGAKLNPQQIQSLNNVGR